MNNNKKIFGICIKHCEILNRISNERVLLQQGDLIRILELSCQKSDKTIVKLYNFDNNTFQNNLFECAKQDVESVVEALWFHLIGTNDKYTRIRIYNDRELVLRVKCGTEIMIKSYENDSNANIKGVIQLIDSVEDAGIGHFIGVKLQKPPVNRDTYLTLYYKQFNQNTSLLLFRIGQLLDALKDAEQQELGPSGKENINSKNILAKITNSPSAYAMSRVQRTTVQIDANKFNTNAVSTTDANEVSPSFSSITLNETVPKRVNNINKQNQIHCNSSIPSYSSDKWVVPKSDNGSGTEHVINIGNQTGTVRKRNEIQVVGNEFTKASTHLTNQFYGKKPLQCNKCHDPLNDSDMIFSCKHCFCLKCLSTQKTLLRCLFTSGKDKPCDYQLKHFEITQVFQKLGESPVIVKRDNSDGVEPLLKCNRCQNIWFTRFSEFIFRCSKCEYFNYYNCNFTHELKTCTEYKNTLKTVGNPNESKNVADNCYKSFMPIIGSSMPQQIPDKASGSDGNEIHMQCIDTNCNGQWFILKTERSPIFKCPTCQMYNCFKCKTIHQNQTCDEYQNALQKKSVRHQSHDYRNSGEEPSKFTTPQKWSCVFCTFDNFSFCYFCDMCGKRSN